jgi:hypothetical protein
MSSSTILNPGTRVVITDNDGNKYEGKISSNGAFLKNGPITIIINDTEEKRFVREEIADIEVKNTKYQTHYSMRGGQKSLRRKNKRNTKRNTKRNAKRRF